MSEAVGVRVGNMLFAGLGSAGHTWHRLNLASARLEWRRCACFPFAPRRGAVAAAAGGKVYVFGGSGRSAEQHSLHQFDSVACYDPDTDCWSELATRLPVGMVGASAAVAGESILIFGGYNKPQFDQFFREYEAASVQSKPAIFAAFLDRKAESFAWNDHIWEFDTRDYRWHDLGQVPHAPNCGSGMIADGAEILLASGEIKPGVRTASVKQATIAPGDVLWRAEKMLPANEQAQEGVAAAFSGKCGKVKILAGGTNFVGARRNYEAGINYAHRDLSKLWRDEIYMLKNDVWELAGRLPQGRANGLTFEVEQGLLLVGGDTQNGQPCLETWLLSYEESSGLTISRSKQK